MLSLKRASAADLSQSSKLSSNKIYLKMRQCEVKVAQDPLILCEESKSDVHLATYEMCPM